VRERGIERESEREGERGRESEREGEREGVRESERGRERESEGEGERATSRATHPGLRWTDEPSSDGLTGRSCRTGGLGNRFMLGVGMNAAANASWVSPSVKYRGMMYSFGCGAFSYPVAPGSFGVSVCAGPPSLFTLPLHTASLPIALSTLRPLSTPY
jgi:hypothetical protein